MTTAMFHMKHQARRTKQGSSGGLAGSGAARGGLAAGLFGLLLAACSSPDEMAEKTGAAEAASLPATGVATASASATSSQPGAAAFEDNASKDEAVREFSYVWPAKVSAVPELVERFTAERDQLLAEQKADWDASLAEFGNGDCISCVNRSFDKTWDVVADLPRFLSLSARFSFYTGGAHGNSAYDALVWDREAEVALDPKAMFRSPEALQSALGDKWCKALKAERNKRAGQDIADDGFFTCPPIADLTVLVGSSDGKAFNRVGLLAAPYVAGSYAEGPYEVTLPVTPAVLAAVKPEYKSAFAPRK